MKAEVKIYAKTIEQEAIDQINTLVETGVFDDCDIRIMPDCHSGAGRLMSRTKARETLKMEDYKEDMKGIDTRSVSEGTIDEAPQAYKPMQEIIDCIEPTAEVIDIIKPVYNFKAQG